ncbi:MAG: LytTR family DNA-binding domain-containing protein [Saprospiraceae bacterium]|nr:LytTR family DNA-binding domain-containing protein [Saprospiraceae bacterium]
MALRTILVDDEPLALDVLETYITQMPELDLVGRCVNAFEANEVLSAQSVDLMFLDIQMPQLTGIDFVKTLKNPPMVVFTTAFPNYAIEGFELDALDYLLKPISLDRFMKASNKAIEQQRLKSPEQLTEGSDFIFVKADKKFVKLRYEDILYIEGLKDYVIIRTNSGRVITLQTMKSLEAKLPQKIFRRIHRSYILNINKINAVVGNMVEIVEAGKAKHIPIGKNYRDDLLQLINENKI